jgi:hypothetical protein
VEQVSSYPELKGKVAVVIGSSRGIGLETATRLANNSACVGIVARPERLLQRGPPSSPSLAPWISSPAFGAAFFTWIAVIFLAGAADRLLVDVGFPYQSQVWYFRILAVALPVAVFFLVRRICRELQASEAHPLRAWTGTLVRRAPDGSFEDLGDGAGPAASEDRARAPRD